MNSQSIYHILVIAFFSLFISACKSDGAFSSHDLSNGNGYSPEIELKPETPLPTLHVEPIKLLPHESKSAVLQVLTYEGDDIDMSDFSNITWSIDDECIAKLDVSNSQATLTGVQKGTTQLHVSAEFDGSVISGQTIVTVYTNKVVSWGRTEFGGDSSSVRDQLVNVKKIVAGGDRFAALKSDGTVIIWGRYSINNIQPGLTNAVDIFNPYYALKGDGTVANLDEETDDAFEQVQSQLVNVKTIFTTEGTAAALKHDGSVVSWGTHAVPPTNTYLGDCSFQTIQPLANVKHVYSTARSFAALKTDGTVVTWGSCRNGGDSSMVELDNVKEIYPTTDFTGFSGAFAALKQDGTVVTWGSSNFGGNSTLVESELYNIQHIAATGSSFAAVRSDGAVITWGYPEDGGDSRAVQSQLVNVKEVFAGARSFAALRGDGTVVTWGASNAGDVQPLLTNVKKVYSTPLAYFSYDAGSTGAYAALKHDGTVVTWGNRNSGGDSELVQPQLTNITDIYPSYRGFVAFQNNAMAAAWPETEDINNLYISIDTVRSELNNVLDITSTYSAYAAIVEN